MTIDDLVEQLKGAIITIGTQSVMAFLSVNAPFFALPVIRQITEFAVNKIISLAIKETEIGAFFAYVDIYTKAQVKAFEEAAIRNKIAQESGTDEEKKKAEEAFIAAARDLIKFNH